MPLILFLIWLIIIFWCFLDCVLILFSGCFKNIEDGVSGGGIDRFWEIVVVVVGGGGGGGWVGRDMEGERNNVKKI